MTQTTEGFSGTENTPKSIFSIYIESFEETSKL